MLKIRNYFARFYRFVFLRALYNLGIGPFWPSKNELVKYYSSETYQIHKKNRKNGSEEWKKWIHEIVGENKKVLDFGCARGLLAKEMLPYSKRVMGIDFSPLFVEEAKTNLGENNAILGDVCDPPESLPKDFDVVWCIDVIEHVLEPAKLIQVAAEHLTKGGRLVLAFPESEFTGKNPEWKNIDRHLWCFDEKGIMEVTNPYFIFEKRYYGLFYVFRKKKGIENRGSQAKIKVFH